MIGTTCRVVFLVTFLWRLGGVHSTWSKNFLILDHGLRAWSPLSPIRTFDSYSSSPKSPEDVQRSCNVYKDGRHFSTNYRTSQVTIDPVKTTLWIKMQHLFTVPIFRAIGFTPPRDPTHHLIPTSMTYLSIIALISDVNSSVRYAKYLLSEKQRKTPLRQLHDAVCTLAVTSTGPKWPKAEDDAFNVPFGVSIVIDYDATHEAENSYHREPDRFHPYKTYGLEIYEEVGSRQVSLRSFLQSYSLSLTARDVTVDEVKRLINYVLGSLAT